MYYIVYIIPKLETNREDSNFSANLGKDDLINNNWALLKQESEP